MRCRWLLLLGSNLESDRTLRAAVADLNTLGSARALTPIKRFAAHGGGKGCYFNTLVALETDLDHEALGLSLKRIEADLGRPRDAGETVVIDVDILACHFGECWTADPHALEKREFDRAAVVELLGMARIQINMAKDENT